MQNTFSQPWNDYELIDAGNNQKLERWGNIITIRPDRNAYFNPVLGSSDWREKAHFEFIENTRNSGAWSNLKQNFESKWHINFNNIIINLQLTKFKHLGIFPEQRVNWDFIANRTSSNDRFLNLFGYTGVASLVAKEQGADVFHCDSVKQVIGWGKENMLSSNLSDIHWVLEDALKYAQREVKRGHKFKGIIMDPPAFGIGANKQRWKIENKFPELLEDALKLKEPDGYIIANTLTSTENVEVTNLCVKTTTGKRLDYGQRTVITD